MNRLPGIENGENHRFRQDQPSIYGSNARKGHESRGEMGDKGFHLERCF